MPHRRATPPCRRRARSIRRDRRQAVGRSDDDEPERHQERAAGEHPAAAVTGDQAAGARRHQPGHQQAEREPGHHPVVGPAGVVDDRPRQHRQQIEGRSPRQDLHAAEHGHHDRAARLPGRNGDRVLCHHATVGVMRSPPPGRAGTAHDFVLRMLTVSWAALGLIYLNAVDAPAASYRLCFGTIVRRVTLTSRLSDRNSPMLIAARSDRNVRGGPTAAN